MSDRDATDHRRAFVAGIILACAAAIGCPAKDDSEGGETGGSTAAESEAGDGVVPIDPMGPESDGST